MPTGLSNNGIQRTAQLTKASVATERGHSMPDLILTTFDWVPELPRGYVRDLRVRWALEGAGLS